MKSIVVMDDLSFIFDSLYPQNSEIQCQIPTSMSPQNDDQTNQKDDHHGRDDYHQKNSNDKRRKGSLLSLDDENANDSKKQKTIRKELERQRRLEMASLYSSLKSLLPHENIKGRRTVSNYLNQATTYIRDLEQKVKELSKQRDALKLEVCNSECHENDDLSVNHCNGGFQVIVSTANCGVGLDEGLPLSRVLQCLIEEGLDVVSCISNRVDNKMVHSIQSQVGDGRSISIGAAELQQKLACTCCTHAMLGRS